MLEHIAKITRSCADLVCVCTVHRLHADKHTQGLNSVQKRESKRGKKKIQKKWPKTERTICLKSSSTVGISAKDELNL